jgi:hypothetical protein
MDTDVCWVRINMQISGVCYQNLIPCPEIWVDSQLIRAADPLTELETLDFRLGLTQGNHELRLVFHNKQYQNYPAGSDMAVRIHHVGFQNLSDDFRVYGAYYPDYPEPWATEQRQQGMELPEYQYADYLGWNGDWRLPFHTPIYPWIHQTLHLGWLL